MQHGLSVLALIPVSRLLPDIAGHVVESVAICRKGTDGSGPFANWVSHPRCRCVGRHRRPTWVAGVWRDGGRLARRLFLSVLGDCTEESQCSGVACRTRRAFGEKNRVRGWYRQAMLSGERDNFVRLIFRLIGDAEIVIHGLHLPVRALFPPGAEAN